MALQTVSFGYSANPSRNDSQGTPTNCYAENMGGENESQWVHYACAGYQSFATLGGVSGVFRGALAFDDTKSYVVSGTGIFKVTSAGVVTALGTLNGLTAAYVARNRKEPNAQIAIVSGGIFKLIENDVLSTPSIDPDVESGQFNSVCSIDGYFVFTKTNGEWFITAIDEGATIDDLEFAQANTKPDTLLRGIVRGRDLILMGPQSIEVYQNTGATDFPFERVTSLGIGITYAPTAVNVTAVVDGGTSDVVIFAANNPDGSYLGVVMLDGYNAKTISPFALDRAIQAETDKYLIKGFAYSENGHTFYTIWGPTFCWTYDCSTGFWHVRKSSGAQTWTLAGCITMNGRQVMAHGGEGFLYQLDTTPQTPASASTIALRHSNDNGGSWVGPRTRNVGTSKSQRVRWLSLGESREDGKVLELTFSNALVEAGTGVAVTILTPPIQAFPNRMVFNAVYCNITSGVSQTSSHKGFITLSVDAEAKTP